MRYNLYIYIVKIEFTSHKIQSFKLYGGSQYTYRVMKLSPLCNSSLEARSPSSSCHQDWCPVKPLILIVDSCLISASSHGLFLVCMQREREKEEGERGRKGWMDTSAISSSVFLFFFPPSLIRTTALSN